MKKQMQNMEQEAALAYQAEVADYSDRIDEAHALWETLHTIINSVVFSAIDAAGFDVEQEDYIVNKLHEEHRYWRTTDEFERRALMSGR